MQTTENAKSKETKRRKTFRNRISYSEMSGGIDPKMQLITESTKSHTISLGLSCDWLDLVPNGHHVQSGLGNVYCNLKMANGREVPLFTVRGAEDNPEAKKQAMTLADCVTVMFDLDCKLNYTGEGQVTLSRIANDVKDLCRGVVKKSGLGWVEMSAANPSSTFSSSTSSSSSVSLSSSSLSSASSNHECPLNHRSSSMKRKNPEQSQSPSSKLRLESSITSSPFTSTATTNPPHIDDEYQDEDSEEEGHGQGDDYQQQPASQGNNVVQNVPLLNIGLGKMNGSNLITSSSSSSSSSIYSLSSSSKSSYSSYSNEKVVGTCSDNYGDEKMPHQCTKKAVGSSSSTPLSLTSSSALYSLQNFDSNISFDYDVPIPDEVDYNNDDHHKMDQEEEDDLDEVLTQDQEDPLAVVVSKARVLLKEDFPSFIKMFREMNTCLFNDEKIDKLPLVMTGLINLFHSRSENSRSCLEYFADHFVRNKVYQNYFIAEVNRLFPDNNDDEDPYRDGGGEEKQQGQNRSSPASSSSSSSNLENRLKRNQIITYSKSNRRGVHPSSSNLQTSLMKSSKRKIGDVGLVESGEENMNVPEDHDFTNYFTDLQIKDEEIKKLKQRNKMLQVLCKANAKQIVKLQQELIAMRKKQPVIRFKLQRKLTAMQQKNLIVRLPKSKHFLESRKEKKLQGTGTLFSYSLPSSTSSSSSSSSSNLNISSKQSSKRKHDAIYSSNLQRKDEEIEGLKQQKNMLIVSLKASSKQLMEKNQEIAKLQQELIAMRKKQPVIRLPKSKHLLKLKKEKELQAAGARSSSSSTSSYSSSSSVRRKASHDDTINKDSQSILHAIFFGKPNPRYYKAPTLLGMNGSSEQYTSSSSPSSTVSFFGWIRPDLLGTYYPYTC